MTNCGRRQSVNVVIMPSDYGALDMDRLRQEQISPITSVINIRVTDGSYGSYGFDVCTF